MSHVEKSQSGVTAELRSLEVRSCEPNATRTFSPSHFCYEVHAWVGEQGDGEVDRFAVSVCSPSWVQLEWAWTRENAAAFQIWDRHPGIVPGRGYWFTESWDHEEIEGAIRLICHRSSPGPDWITVANRIGRLLVWEWAGLDDDQINHRAGLPSLERPSQTSEGHG